MTSSLVLSSSQVLTSPPSNLVLSLSQVLTSPPSNLVLSSSQVLTSPPSNLVLSSSQVLASPPSNLVSSPVLMSSLVLSSSTVLTSPPDSMYPDPIFSSVPMSSLMPLSYLSVFTQWSNLTSSQNLMSSPTMQRVSMTVSSNVSTSTVSLTSAFQATPGFVTAVVSQTFATEESSGGSSLPVITTPFSINITTNRTSPLTVNTTVSRKTVIPQNTSSINNQRSVLKPSQSLLNSIPINNVSSVITNKTRGNSITWQNTIISTSSISKNNQPGKTQFCYSNNGQPCVCYRGTPLVKGTEAEPLCSELVSEPERQAVVAMELQQLVPSENIENKTKETIAFIVSQA